MGQISRLSSLWKLPIHSCDHIAAARFKHAARVGAITKNVKLVSQYRIHDLRANRFCWHGHV